MLEVEEFVPMNRTYRYQAIDRAGRLQTGTLQADSLLSAQHWLQALGLLVQHLVEVLLPPKLQVKPPGCYGHVPLGLGEGCGSGQG